MYIHIYIDYNNILYIWVNLDACEFRLPSVVDLHVAHVVQLRPHSLGSRAGAQLFGRGAVHCEWGRENLLIPWDMDPMEGSPKQSVSIVTWCNDNDFFGGIPIFGNLYVARDMSREYDGDITGFFRRVFWLLFGDGNIKWVFPSGVRVKWGLHWWINIYIYIY